VNERVRVGERHGMRGVWVLDRLLFIPRVMPECQVGWITWFRQSRQQNLFTP
jgi:hypothetical protein